MLAVKIEGSESNNACKMHFREEDEKERRNKKEKQEVIGWVGFGRVGLKQARPELGKRDRMKSLPCFSAKLEKKREGENMQCTCRTCMYDYYFLIKFLPVLYVMYLQVILTLQAFVLLSHH